MLMLTIIFAVLMISVFWKLIMFAIKATWAITKCVFMFLLLPIALIVLAALGLFYLAIPILVIVGIVSIIKNGSARVATQ